jgi:hypothetical protein
VSTAPAPAMQQPRGGRRRLSPFDNGKTAIGACRNALIAKPDANAYSRSDNLSSALPTDQNATVCLARPASRPRGSLSKRSHA